MRTIAFSRPIDRIAESERMISKLGMRPLSACSLVMTEGDVDHFKAFQSDLSLGLYDCLIVTSSTAVEMAFRLSTDDEQLRCSMADMDIIPIGNRTRRELSCRGIITMDPPDEHSSNGILESYGGRLEGKRVGILRSDKGTETLVSGLLERSCIVDEIITYGLEPSHDVEGVRTIMSEMAKGDVDAIIFTSSLSVNSFILNSGLALDMDKFIGIMSRSLTCAIGEPTAITLESLGIKVDLVPKEADFRLLVEELSRSWGKER